MSQESKHRRRHSLGTMAMTATAGLGDRALGSPANTSFASMREIDAGVLNVGCAEAGRAHGPAVVLLHGWPYDIGHNVPLEAPRACAQAIVDVDTY